MDMATVAITDYSFGELGIERRLLEGAGHKVVDGQCKTADELIALTRQADAVIVQFAPVSGPVVEAMERAKVIVRYGIGYDNVDIQVAQRRGIPVCNVPDYCIDEVADHTLAMILALTRQVAPNAAVIRAGGWKLGVALDQMRTLRNMTAGIVGFGRIGRGVVKRLVAFGGRVLVFDPVVEPAAIRAIGAEPAGLDELLKTSDVISLHCPTNDVTRKMICASSLAQMKRGSLLVNLGRGGLVDGPALIAALQSGQLAGAALDVYEPEPLPADCPLRTMDNVLVHSHIASASAAAVQNLRETVAQVALKALRGEPLPNIVNGVPAGAK
jgi:D-3-phosphoglycerate dehydrogenase